MNPWSLSMKRLRLPDTFSQVMLEQVCVHDKRGHACQAAAGWLLMSWTCHVENWEKLWSSCFVPEPPISSWCHHCDITAAVLILSCRPTEWKQKHLLPPWVSVCFYIRAVSMTTWWMLFLTSHQTDGSPSPAVCPLSDAPHTSPSPGSVSAQMNLLVFLFKLVFFLFCLPVYPLQNVHHNRCVCGLSVSAPFLHPPRQTLCRYCTQRGAAGQSNKLLCVFICFFVPSENKHLFCRVEKTKLIKWGLVNEGGGPKKQTDL